MTHGLFHIPDDPLGCRDDLCAALADPAVRSQGHEGEHAAYRLAVALGRCRLFGVTLSDDLAGTLPPDLATASAKELARFLDAWTDEARDLGERWDTANDPAEADDLCGGLLQLRMEAWAAILVLNEAYLDATEEDPASVRDLSMAIDQCQRALDRFDAGLEEETEVLATVTGTNLLRNWRALLAPAFTADLPWWLDGRLEEAARRADETAAATMPGVRVWKALRLSLNLAPEPVLAPLAGDWLAAASETSGLMTAWPGQTLCWVSPDEMYQAELQVPAESTPDQDAISRPLNVTRCADECPATELTGQIVRLAGVKMALDSGTRAFFRLADLRGSSLRLEVGEPPVVWRYRPQGSEHDKHS